MKKFSGRPLWAIVILFLIFLFIDWGLAVNTTVPCGNNPQEQTTGDSTKQCTHKRSTIFVGHSPLAFMLADFFDQHNGSVNAIAGLFIAAFTYTLWRSSEKMWNVALDQAETARMALKDLERPIVYVRASYPSSLIPAPTSENPLAIVRRININCSNYGRTPANITRIEYVVLQTESGQTPPYTDPLKIGGRELPVGVISANGDPYEEGENIIPDLDEIPKGGRNTISWWVIGFVRYSDIFRGHYITGFCMVYDRIGRRFVIRGSDKHNYAHAENPDKIPNPSSRS